MDKFFRTIIIHKKMVLIIFLLSAIISAFLSTFVPVNYNMVDYLPKDASSTIGVKIMEEEFSGDIPNAKIMLTDVSIQEALEYKERIASIKGITSLSWLDDIIGLDTLTTIPLEFLDARVIENYYKNNKALISITVESGKELEVVKEIYELIGENNAAGEAINSAETQSMSVSEVLEAMMILLPIVIIILILTTSSWAEPLFFLSTIGVAILINMGTNIIFDEISFVTRTVSPVLQLAVSLDYAIFLLHSFNDHRTSNDPENAMILAMKEALPTVAASAATTVIGFMALIFMRFGIGADLGLNLLKGVIFSFLSVMIFLPVITLLFYKIIDKTRHGKLIPSFQKLGSLFLKLRVPFLILALVVVIPSFLAQSKAEFMYGLGSITAASRVGSDSSRIEEVFGRDNPLVLLVPKENPGTEADLCKDLSQLPHITNVVTYVTSVGSEIPAEFVPEEAYQQFYSDQYTRIILSTDTTEEGPDAFDTVQAVMDTAAKYYDAYYLSGTSATLYDMKNIVSTDTRLVNLIAIIGIFFVLLVTFRSLSIPFILIFTIETAIWINLSFPYFTGKSLSFIGYLIISTVQLGATVDYAILITNTYFQNRKNLRKYDAMRLTISNNLIAILTSAIILASAGFALALTSNNPIISELGILLGRGTLLSLAMVSFVLPALLLIFDKVIRKTSLNMKM